MEICPGVHIIPGVIANAYLIIEPSGLTLVDTGLPRSEQKILQYAAQLGYKPKSIKRIIITHADQDHIGSLASLMEITSARVYAHEIEADAIRLGISSRKPHYGSGLKGLLYKLVNQIAHVKPADVHVNLRHGDILPILGGMQVIETPGHTPGHISLYAPAPGVLFTGDAVQASGHSLIPSKGEHTWSEPAALRSITRLQETHARIICAGHGTVIYAAREKLHSPDQNS